jgi:cytochrome c553
MALDSGGSMKRRSELAQGASSWRRIHSAWWWAGLLVVVVLLVLFGRSAAAQRVRGVEIIEQALALQPDERAGKALYRKHCASCHRDAGRGDSAKVTPALAGQVPVYLIKQIVDFAEADRTAPEMHHVVARKAVSRPQSMRDVAAYLTALEPPSHPEVGDGRQHALGHRFYQGLCAYCHGAGGEGDEAHATPALQRQHYSYLLMQMRWLAIDVQPPAADAPDERVE